MRKLQFVY